MCDHLDIYMLVLFQKQGTVPVLLSSQVSSQPALFLKVVIIPFHHSHDLGESGDFQDYNSGK